MTVERVPGCRDVWLVDTMLLETPGMMSAYIVAGDRPVIVDPGDAAGVDRLLEALETIGIDPADVAYLFPTHAHLDHAGATGELARRCPNATVVLHERAEPYLTDEAKLQRLVEGAREALGAAGEAYGEPEPVPADRVEVARDGDRLEFGGRTLELLDTPGHAPHHLSAYDPDEGTLFAGDAAGATFGRDTVQPTTPPPDFDLEASLETARRLRDLGPERVCYGHYGATEDGTAALEAFASILPEWVDAVETADAARSEGAPLSVHLSDRWTNPTVEADARGVVRYLRERARADDTESA